MQEKLVYDNRVKRKNILALNEKIAAIRYYERNPSYKSVGRHFNCSPDQIKRIIQQKEEIIKAWSMRTRKPSEMGLQQIKSVQVSILGKAVHEWIKRMMYYKDFIITDGLIQKMALQFKSILAIRNFFPNQHWVDNFRSSYNVSDNDTKKLTFGHTEGYSVQLIDIIRDLVNECPSYVAEAVDSVSTNVPVMKKPTVNLIATSKPLPVVSASKAATTTASPVRAAGSVPSPQIQTVSPIAGAGIRPPFTMTIIPMASVPSALLQELPTQSRGEKPNSMCQIARVQPTETIKRKMEIKTEVISDDESDSGTANFETLNTSPELSRDADGEACSKESTEPTVVIRTTAEARKCLELLEDFALLRENFRLIGLLTRADEVLQEMDGQDDNVDIE